MLVQCRCGQEFVVHETRFPFRVNCHMCGVKFMVHEDGALDEIRAIAVNVICRCGKAYSINALQFPRKVHCIDCNHRFSVLDTGEILDVEIELENAVGLDSTAFHAHGPSEWKTPPVTAIQAELPCEVNIERVARELAPLPASTQAYDPHEERMRRQLAALDRQWEEQRERYAVNVFRLYRFYPTRKTCLTVGFFAITAFMLTMTLLFAMMGISLLNVFLIFPPLVCVLTWFVPDILQNAALHDVGESRWLKERDTLIRMHEAKQDYRAETRPSDSDDSVC